MLQQMNGLRIEQMCFSFTFPLVESACWQLVVRDFHLAEGVPVFGQRFAGDFVQSHTLYTGYRTGEVMVDYIAVESNDLHDLCSLIGLEGGDTHL